MSFQVRAHRCTPREAGAIARFAAGAILFVLTLLGILHAVLGEDEDDVCARLVIGQREPPPFRQLFIRRVFEWRATGVVPNEDGLRLVRLRRNLPKDERRKKEAACTKQQDNAEKT